MPGADSRLGLRFLLDQNVSKEIAAWLQRQRPTWEVLHTSDVVLQGSSDQEVFKWAQDNGCIIVTFDLDFADQRAFPLGRHYGVIRIRARPTTTERVIRSLTRLLEQVDDQDLRDTLVIIGRSNIRLRRAEDYH